MRPSSGPPAHPLVRQQGRTLLLAFTAALLLWNLPLGGFLLYPFKLLATWLHEMSHGLMMLVTGTGFARLEIFEDTSGLAHPGGPSSAFVSGAIASAGYLGTAVIGTGLLLVGNTVRAARRVLYGLGIALVISLVFIANTYGLAAIVVGIAFFLAAGRYLPDRAAMLLVDFVAAQACINAVLDIRVLFSTKQVVDGVVVGASDAHTMAAVSFGDHRLWATVWLVASFACFFVAVRVVLRRQIAEAVAAARAERTDRADAAAQR